MFDKVWLLAEQKNAVDTAELQKLLQLGHIDAQTPLRNTHTDTATTVGTVLKLDGIAQEPVPTPTKVEVSPKAENTDTSASTDALSAESTKTAKLDAPSIDSDEFCESLNRSLQQPATSLRDFSFRHHQAPGVFERATKAPTSSTEEPTLRHETTIRPPANSRSFASAPSQLDKLTAVQPDGTIASSAQLQDGSVVGDSQIHHRSSGFGSDAETVAEAQDADEVDYAIYGTEMQFVEVELDEGEAVLAEPGAMAYMDDGIRMTTIFGDGSKHNSGIFRKLVSSGKRLLTGEGLFMTVFHAETSGKSRIGFAAPVPGKILAVDLRELDGQFICQKDAFLCAAKGVSLDIFFQKKITSAFFGGEGFVLQRLTGDGYCFVHAGGSIIRRDLAPGQRIQVDTGSIVGFTHDVDYSVSIVPGIMTPFLGGEGFFLSQLTGPGTVWVQSLPVARLATRLFSNTELFKQLQTSKR